MRPITTRQKLSVMFALYVFAFIFIIAGAAYYFFQAVTTNELKSQSIYLGNELIRNFVTVRNTELVLDQREKSTLEEELSETNSSALILDSSFSIKFGYGNFTFFNEQDAMAVKTIMSLSKQTQQKQKPSFLTTQWRDQHMLISAIPLVSGSIFHGVIIIGKPITTIQHISSSMLLAFFLFALASFIASMILGNVIMRKSLEPLQQLSQTIHTIDLDSLTTAVPPRGSPDDEIVQLVHTFNRMVLRIQTMAELQKEFISNVSHELKTPITTVASSLELLALDAPKQANSISAIRQSLFSLNTLIDQLMQLSKLLQTSPPPRVAPYPLSSLLATIVREHLKEIHSKKLTLEIPKHLPTILTISKEYATLLFSNIISNAIKFSHTGKPISIQSSPDGKTITITNTGIGIPKNDVHRVWDTFYRSADARAHTKGSGVGLSIIKRICDLYSIHITIQSDHDRETKITLTLPPES